MHRKPAEIRGPREDSSNFCAHLAEGLHAMAQPLTILRSVAVASAAPELPPIERLRYLDISREQIERACVLFEGLQDLVIAQRHKSNRVVYDLAQLVTRVVTDREPDLQASSAGLSIDLPDGPVLLCGDLPRTRQAAGAALKVALSLSGAGDLIELLLEQRDGSVELAVRCRQHRNTPLNSLQSLRLALAETNIRSQGGQYECVVDPFCVRLSLPMGDISLERATELRDMLPSDRYSTSISPSAGNRFESERPL